MLREITRTALVALAVSSSANGGTWLRVNQLGYLPVSEKAAVAGSTDGALTVTEFVLHDALTHEAVWRSSAVAPFGPYGPFRSSVRLDFSTFDRDGAYYIRAGDAVSPAFRIGPHVYDGAADVLLRYMRQQRCGYNPFLDDSCHTRDGYVIYRPGSDSVFIDAVGGWHDASDYLQYVTTSATAVVSLLSAYRTAPEVFGDVFDASGRPGANGVPDVLDEAGWGIAWLLKMNPAPREMYHQIADDRDHRGFRLPTEDTVDYGRGRERPVYYVTGQPQGIHQFKNRTTGVASTAGKFASAFALAAMVFGASDQDAAEILRERAIAAFAFGEEFPGVCQTAPCRSPYFYEEDNWADDMELAAAALFELTGDAAYRAKAATYGAMEAFTPWMGADAARHYQWYPFMNHGRAMRARLEVRSGAPDHPPDAPGSSSPVAPAALTYLRKGVDTVFARGRSNPFLFGVPFIWCSNNLASAMLAQCMLYREISRDATYADMEGALRDWLLGCNPWGTSMIVGLPAWGTSPKDPHSAFTHLHGYPIDGGLVDGPVAGSVFKGLLGIQLSKPDAFSEVQSDLAVYHDDWGDYSTNEPTMDGTASLTLPFAMLEREGRDQRLLRPSRVDNGGIVRLDTTSKTVYLMFSGHEFADGGESIRRTLSEEAVLASFFFTGDFFRDPAHADLIRSLAADGHYLGPHSDRHLLYAAWSRRDSLLVSREEFLSDLSANYAAMKRFGITKSRAPYLLPPYEWYNRAVARWSDSVGVTIVNFTPGTFTNADYTYPEMGESYASSDSIITRLMRVEAGSPAGLKGALLLLHVGTEPRRTDKLYARLPELIHTLRSQGYRFAELPVRGAR
jgi:peptidoglycan/xylan/chitin deacetylase (PgdA/CDA1 family)